MIGKILEWVPWQDAMLCKYPTCLRKPYIFTLGIYIIFIMIQVPKVKPRTGWIWRDEINLPNHFLLGSTRAIVPGASLDWKGAALTIYPLESLENECQCLTVSGMRMVTCTCIKTVVKWHSVFEKSMLVQEKYHSLEARSMFSLLVHFNTQYQEYIIYIYFPSRLYTFLTHISHMI